MLTFIHGDVLQVSHTHTQKMYSLQFAGKAKIINIKYGDKMSVCHTQKSVILFCLKHVGLFVRQ